jgi:hypothetical protein
LADPTRSPQTDDAGRGPDRGAANSRSRWGLILGIILAIALVGLIVFLHLTGTLGPGTH